MYVCEGFPDATLVQGLLALLALLAIFYIDLFTIRALAYAAWLVILSLKNLQGN